MEGGVREMVLVSMERFLNVLGRRTLDGLIVTGFIDSGSGLSPGIRPNCRLGQFHALWDEVYLELGEILLRFKATDDCSGLRMEQVERIEPFFEVDPDDTFGAMSMLRILLPSGRDSLRVERVDIYTDSRESLEPGVVTALALVGDMGDYLFFNPQDLANRIHVGNIQSRDQWLAWVRDGRYVLKSYAVLVVDE